MPRSRRYLPSGYAYHMLNRSRGGRFIFDDDEEAALFQTVLCDATQRHPDARLLAYCIMADHWHMVFWPRTGDVLGKIMHWLSVTHAQRYHARQGANGEGHLYASRFRSFPIALDDHLLTVMRYAERNPVRQGFVERAADWPWSSAHKPNRNERRRRPEIAAPPIDKPQGWQGFLQRTSFWDTVGGLKHIRQSVNRGTPFGASSWVRTTAENLDLQSSTRPRGRPRKNASPASCEPADPVR